MLSKLFEKKIHQPNLQSAPDKSVDLSGSALTFKNPPKTTPADYKELGNQFDLYDLTQYDSMYGHLFLEVYSSSWMFYKGLLKSFDSDRCGTCFTDLMIFRPETIPSPNFSFFCEKTLRHWVHAREAKLLQESNDQYKDDEEYPEGTLNHYLYHIPESSENYEIVNYAGANWIELTPTLVKDLNKEVPKPRSHLYYIPITEHCVLNLSFTYSSQCDYIHQKMIEFKEAFMNSVTLSLSEESLKQKRRFE
ncbi:hypothetical protein [Marinibactrum halimedae]|uniref:Uncharacterized protein n=1 Tax=Marinibactrum halimedae TaxID=1444977 RepID=A0AA37WMR5_9GAMM|nr:hypothetical protein [Marinibactrum halimedae]MCD9458507.1 hypothetical protein [Marinibactrum halimedae]GLS26630.1 hypothetical protein GCM10007877_23460 [Marinibactrum halimedae]